MRIDVHQHVWTTPLQEALGRRTSLPLIAVQNGLHTVHCAGEQPWVLDATGENATQRSRLLDQDGLDAAIVAISSPIGIEALPREPALELIDRHLEGVGQLGPRFGAWAPLPTDRPQPEDVDRLAARRPIGISVASGAIASPARLAALRPTLARIEELDLPLFVHPGRAIGDHVAHASLDEPLWWRALTDYVAQMQAAWLSWVTGGAGAGEHHRLKVIFAMLAGLAPLGAERLAARGGPPIDLADPNVFYDTSSYGLEAIEAMTVQIPTLQLLYGSDRPVVEPTRTLLTPILQTNAGRLFGAAFRERGVKAAPPAPTLTRVAA
jgi:predicted TIM-barrel fold metal-dependent hydrolase